MVFEREQELDSQWAAIRSIAAKIGSSAEKLRNWVRQAERDAGRQVLQPIIEEDFGTGSHDWCRFVTGVGAVGFVSFVLTGNTADSEQADSVL